MAELSARELRKLKAATKDTTPTNSGGSLASKILGLAPKSKAVMLSQTSIGDKPILAKMKIPILNVMMSGKLDGGMTCGITQIVGDSRTFKSNTCVEVIEEFLDTVPGSVVVFMDSEFSARQIMEARGIDFERVVYIPFENLEEMKINLVQIIGGLERDSKVMFFIDSISQVASIKEVNDATDGDVKVDLTRAKEMNSVFRMITPMLNIRNLPLFCINSFYTSMSDKYADPIIKGGKQQFLSSDAIWFVTRSQDKDDKTKVLKGWNFNYTMLKSRFVKEKAKMSLHVTYEGGIDVCSSLFDLAVEAGLIKTSGAWSKLHEKFGRESQFYRSAVEMDPEFFKPILSDQVFIDHVENKYKVNQADFDETESSDGLVEIDVSSLIQAEDTLEQTT